MARLGKRGNRSDAVEAGDEVRIQPRLRKAERTTVDSCQLAGQLETRERGCLEQHLQRLHTQGAGDVECGVHPTCTLASTGSPARISSRAASSWPKRFQSKKPRGRRCWSR